MVFAVPATLRFTWTWLTSPIQTMNNNLLKNTTFLINWWLTVKNVISFVLIVLYTKSLWLFHRPPKYQLRTAVNCYGISREETRWSHISRTRSRSATGNGGVRYFENLYSLFLSFIYLDFIPRYWLLAYIELCLTYTKQTFNVQSIHLSFNQTALEIIFHLHMRVYYNANSSQRVQMLTSQWSSVFFGGREVESLRQ